ncbi:MAG: hypothetical protein JWM04_851 [Verrucomicrobiales bacterium]|nr:hypothetical protein [Verrucomicrobiales bacterium]
MSNINIAHCRLNSQQINTGRSRNPAEVVASLGAMQAQDYGGALWGIGLRLPGSTEKSIEMAIAERKIVRTWPMRGTLHFVASSDVRWMLELLTPRIIAGSRKRWEALELDNAIFKRCETLFVQELQGDRQVSRDDLLAVLEREGIKAGPQRGYHILWRLAQEGVICFGARQGKQHTFALLEEWAPMVRKPEREAALATLAERYFTGHGPATLQDFVWWSGLKVSDARNGLQSVIGKLTKITVNGSDYWMAPKMEECNDASKTSFLLPGFDEYLLGYRDRSAVLQAKHAPKIVPGNNGVFRPTVVVGGQVVGTWKRDPKKARTVMTASPFVGFKKSEKQWITEASKNFGRFVGLPAEILFA